MPDALIPAADSPQLALLIFDRLSRHSTAQAVLSCGHRLLAASAVVPAAFRQKYLDRANECFGRLGYAPAVAAVPVVGGVEVRS